MNKEFQAVYRLRSGEGYGEPQTFNMIAHREADVRTALDSSDCKVISVVEVRPIVDWEKPVWSLDEFAAVLSIKGTTLSKNKGDSLIPWSMLVNGVPRRVAMRYIEETLNDAGKRIVRELAA